MPGYEMKWIEVLELEGLFDEREVDAKKRRSAAGSRKCKATPGL